MWPGTQRKNAIEKGVGPRTPITDLTQWLLVVCLNFLGPAVFEVGVPFVLPVLSPTTMYKRVAHVIGGLPISPWNLPFLYALIQQFPATRTAGVLSASMYGVDASLPQHTQKQPSTSARWELVDKLPNSLNSLVDYEACSALSPIVSQVD